MLILCLYLFGCENPDKIVKEDASSGILILATTPYLYDACKYITKDYESVDVQILQPDDDFHQWKLSEGQIELLQEADLLVLNGAGYEPWLDYYSVSRSKLIVTSNSFRDRWISTSSVSHSHGNSTHSHEITNPYFYLNPELAGLQLDRLTEILIKKNLFDEELVGQRTKEFKSSLESLDKKWESILTKGNFQLLGKNEKMVYFIKRYDGNSGAEKKIQFSENKSDSLYFDIISKIDSERDYFQRMYFNQQRLIDYLE